MELVIKPFTTELKSVIAPVRKETELDNLRDGFFAVNYEPSKSELAELQAKHIIPRCSVRGVGWNSSTRAWVASWLPLNHRRRLCSTFSTRKFGYHEALKRAIAQRLRAELLIYGRRKYPVMAEEDRSGLVRTYKTYAKKQEHEEAEQVNRQSSLQTEEDMGSE